MHKLFLMVGILLAIFPPTFGQTLPTNLHTSFLRPGKYLELGYREGGGGLPAEAFEVLRLKDHGMSKPIHRLSDLKGAVLIDSFQKALDYVRLTTSLPTWYLHLYPQEGVVEIIDWPSAQRMCNYGLPNDPLWDGNSGFMGILSESAMQTSGVSAATVKPDRGGYTTVRWLLAANNPPASENCTILLVQEKVSRDGSYRRKILKQGPASDAFGIHWWLPRFK